MDVGATWTRDYSIAPLDLDVLVVEDDESNRLVVDGVLKLFQCRAHHVSNGTAAVDLACSGRFDVVLMDYHLPGLDGVAATRAIRTFETQRSRPRIPIIGLTGSAMAAEREECLTAGMDCIIPKPFQFAALRTALEEWVPNRRGAAAPFRGGQATPG